MLTYFSLPNPLITTWNKSPIVWFLIRPQRNQYHSQRSVWSRDYPFKICILCAKHYFFSSPIIYSPVPGYESLHVVPSPTLRPWVMCNKWLWFVHINITMWVDYRASPGVILTHSRVTCTAWDFVRDYPPGRHIRDNMMTLLSERCFVLCMTCNIYWLVWCLLNSRPSFKGWLSFCIGYI